MNHQMRRFSENIFLKQVMSPVANPTDGVFPGTSTYIDVAEYERFAFLVQVGTSDDTAITARVVQATAAAGTGKKSISGAAITNTSLAGSSGSRWALIEVERQRLDINNDFRYVALDVAATGGSASAMAVLFIGWRMRKIPPTYGADKAEIVIVDG